MTDPASDRTSPQSPSQAPLNIDEFEHVARARLSPMAYDYYRGGSWDEITLGDNCGAFRKLQLQYRVLRDVSDRQLATTVLGQPVSMPILAAPTAFQRLADDAEGEVATARAVGSRGTIMMLSTLSTRDVEDVVAASPGPVWFQLYVYKDRGATRALVERAVAAGCQALVLTVDAQIWGVRERDERNGFQLPAGMTVRNLLGDDKGRLPRADGSSLGAYIVSMFDESLTWKDLDWLVSISDLPVVVKGIVHPEDGRLAAEHGASAVVVSNHGGRQLDTSPATLDVLPQVVDAVDGDIEVLLDGGIRRGSDVLKAIALGARAVGIGRPLLWGLAADGQAGVERVLDLLRDELDRALGLCGCRSLDEVGPELIFRQPGAN